MRFTALARRAGFFIATALLVGTANAGQGMLRISCGSEEKVDIYVDGKLKGECPLDVAVAEGRHTVKAVKAVDADRVKTWESAQAIGDGVAKKLDISLGAATLTPQAVARAEAAQRKQIEAHKLALRQLGYELGRYFRDCDTCPEMLPIPAGEFDMGSNNDDTEKPVHRVRVSAFAMGRTEVTQGQWQTIMGNNPSKFVGCDDCPVEFPSWDDAQEFIRKLNASTGKTYRLPSEAEWEYSCRAGGLNTYCGGESVDTLAWHGDNSGGKPHQVGRKPANAFGLHDMSGNVTEYVEDCWHNSYRDAPSDGSAWTSRCTDNRRVRRGGSVRYATSVARATAREPIKPDTRNYFSSGFRLAQTL